MICGYQLTRNDDQVGVTIRLLLITKKDQFVKCAEKFFIFFSWCVKCNLIKKVVFYEKNFLKLIKNFVLINQPIIKLSILESQSQVKSSQ